MSYRCEAASVAGFVQQVAVSHLTHGYFFYVAGQVPAGKAPADVDRKLVALYDIDVSKWTRARRRKAGAASIGYVRFERFFVLLATHGTHPIFERERSVLEDFRRRPLTFAGYSISHRGGHSHVRIAEPVMRDLRAHFFDLALRRPAEAIAAELHALPYEPWAPVRRQTAELLRLVNRRRAIASLEPVQASCLRLLRRPVSVFRSEIVPPIDRAA